MPRPGPRPASRPRRFAASSTHPPEGELRYLTRPLPAIKRIWSEFQILSSLESGTDSTHSAPVRIYDASGVWVSTLHAGVDLTDENLIHDLRVASERGGS